MDSKDEMDARIATNRVKEPNVIMAWKNTCKKGGGGKKELL